MAPITYLEADLARGLVRVVGSITRNGVTFVLAVSPEGERHTYLPQHLALLTGEIARVGTYWDFSLPIGVTV